MIDFKNGAFLKLTKVRKPTNVATVKSILIPGEEIIAEYQTVRDFVMFTNKRIIAVNVQGLTGVKKDFSSLPYSKIQAFSIETAGVFDLDAELEIYFSGLGKVKFDFRGDSDVAEIARLIGEKIL